MEERQNNIYRYERKYILGINYLNEFLASLHSQNYFKKFPDRTINNMYYDDYNFLSVSENLDGLSKRKKYRVRWYGSSSNRSNKKLEIKIKNEFLNYKKNINLGLIKLNDLNKIDEFKDDVINSLFDSKDFNYYSLLLTKRPSLFNSYKRMYFENQLDNVRLTIDNDLFFFSPITKLNLKERNIIIEAKFNKDVNFLNKFNGLSLTRYSKYVKGTLYTSFFSSKY